MTGSIPDHGNGTSNFELPLIFGQNKYIIFICALSFVCSVATDTMNVSMIGLMSDLICKDLDLNGPGCTSDRQSLRLSSLQLTCDMMTLALGSICTMVIGELSDRLGRKPMFRVNIGITFASMALLSVVTNSNLVSFHPTVIVSLYCLNSIGGATSALFTLMLAYIADIVPEEVRTKSFTLLMATQLLGLCIGPLIASQILGTLGLPETYLMYMSLGLYFVGFLGLTMIPESKIDVEEVDEGSSSGAGVVVTAGDDSGVKITSSTEIVAVKSPETDLELAQEGEEAVDQPWNSSKFESLLHNLFESVVQPLTVFWLPYDPVHGYYRRIEMILLTAIYVLVGCPLAALSSIIPVYAVQQFGWKTEQIGYFAATFGLSMAVMMFFGGPVVTNYLNSRFETTQTAVDKPDLIIIRASIAAIMVSIAVIGCASSSVEIYMGISIVSLAGLFAPACKSSIIKYLPVGLVGTVMGAVHTVHDLFLMAGVPFVNAIYRYCLREGHPGGVFGFVLGYLGVVLVLLVVLVREPKKIQL